MPATPVSAAPVSADPVSAVPMAGPPSGRDMAIFYEVRVLRRRQAAVAKQFELAQSRISQIVAAVGKWRAETHPSDAGEPVRESRQRMANWECRERTEVFLGWAMADYLESRKDLVSTKSGRRGEHEFEEKTVKQQRASGQHLRAAMQLNRELREYDRIEPPLPPLRRPLNDGSYPEEVAAALTWLRQVERGEISVDVADHHAAHAWQDSHLPYPRLWGKYELATSSEAGQPALPSRAQAGWGRYCITPENTIVAVGPVPQTDWVRLGFGDWLRSKEAQAVDQEAVDKINQSAGPEAGEVEAKAKEEIVVTADQEMVCDEPAEQSVAAEPPASGAETPPIINSSAPAEAGKAAEPKKVEAADLDTSDPEYQAVLARYERLFYFGRRPTEAERRRILPMAKLEYLRRLKRAAKQAEKGQALKRLALAGES